MNNNAGTETISNNETCKNCGKELHGPYCSHCGQHNKEHRLTFGTLTRDFLGDVFSLDSRLVKTIRLLVQKPGQMTSQFLTGHRVAFVPPIRLYVAISFIYFLLVMLISPYSANITVDGENISEDTRPAIIGWSVNETSDPEDEGKPEDEKSRLGTFLTEKTKKLTREEDQFQNMIGQNLPKMMFFLVPFFALFIKILYRKTDFFFSEHLIFSLHFHSFTFLWLTITLLLKSALLCVNTPVSEILGLLMKCWIPIYLFKSLRCVYSGSVWLTVFRETLLLGTYFILTLLCFFALIMLTLVFL